jgi:hypothetical protein
MVFLVPQILNTSFYLNLFPILLETLNYGWNRSEHWGRLGQPRAVL